MTGKTVEATAQAGEPALAQTLAGTVWFRYQTRTAGLVVFDVSASKPTPGHPSTSVYSVGTVYAELFSGSTLGSLKKVGAFGNVLFVGNAERQSIEVNVSAGATFYVRVAADTYGRARSVVLQWGSPAANDRFVLGPTLTGAEGSRAGTTLGATVEAGEPSLGVDVGGWRSAPASVWYRWVAAETGTALLSASGPYPHVVEVYPESALATLVRTGRSGRAQRVSVSAAAAGFEDVTVPLALAVEAGQRFVLRVVPAGGARSRFSLAWTMGAPPNDRRSTNVGPVPIGSTSALTLVASNRDATPDPSGEDRLGRSEAHASVWFGIFVGEPLDRRVTIETTGSSFDTVLGVYESTAAGTARFVTSDDDSAGGGASRVTFTLDAEVFWIVVDGKNGGEGTIRLRSVYQPEGPPPNDDLARAQVISGADGGVDGTFIDATRERGDPRDSLDRTVWYRWVAPKRGRLTLTARADCANVFSSCPLAEARLFRGATQWRNLRPVTAAAGEGYAVKEGVTYSILVTPGTAAHLWRDFRLSWAIQTT